MPVYGTRPEAIKMAPIIKALEASDVLEPFVTVTEQHRAMLDQVKDLFGIEPDHDLNIIQPRQTLNAIIDRNSTRLNSSNVAISYAVFFLLIQITLELHYHL